MATEIAKFKEKIKDSMDSKKVDLELLAKIGTLYQTEKLNKVEVHLLSLDSSVPNEEPMRIYLTFKK